MGTNADLSTIGLALLPSPGALRREYRPCLNNIDVSGDVELAAYVCYTETPPMHKLKLYPNLVCVFLSSWKEHFTYFALGILPLFFHTGVKTVSCSC